MQRRTLIQRGLTLGLALSSGLWWSRAHANSEFQQYLRQQNQGFAEYQTAWQTYQQQYQRAFEQYQSRVQQAWQNPQRSSQTRWVEYSPDLTTETVVDFANNQVRVRWRTTEDSRADEQRMQQALGIVQRSRVQDAVQRDPVLQQIGKHRSQESQPIVAGVSNREWQQAIQQGQRQQQQTSKGPVSELVIQLPSSALPKRAENFRTHSERMGKKWNVPAPLILAIMETESSFNPLARSHVPAFGLMQIVPGSAGRDATALVYGRERLLTAQELYQVDTNIEMGAAYLHILDQRYLRAITNPQSRRYCVIAAYNTGAGNVARAFTGKNAVGPAAAIINRMTPAQVFDHLVKHLPFQETRDYMHKVTRALPTYMA